MHEIICPNCKKAFKIDEAGYADIMKQVRDSEFEQQLLLSDREFHGSLCVGCSSFKFYHFPFTKTVMLNFHTHLNHFRSSIAYFGLCFIKIRQYESHRRY